MGWQGAVEAKCGGCERGLLFQWGSHGRRGRNSRHKLAGITQGNWFSLYGKIAQEDLFGSVVKRRGGQNNPLWHRTPTWGMASA